LALLPVGKVQENLLAPIRYYLFGKKPVQTITGTTDWQWARYADHTDPVKLPPWLADCAPGYVTPPANNVGEYDYVGGNVRKNISAWIDLATQRAAR
jgi:hypothetical protein